MKRTRHFILLFTFAALLAACGSTREAPVIYVPPTIIPNRDQILVATPPPNNDWTPAEIAILTDLWLGGLPSTPPTSSNAVADSPEAAALGHRLFFDTRLSANNQVACATCHRPDLLFTDGLPLSHGTRTTVRNVPTVIGAGFSPWLLWDGHKDSLWAQALEPIEHPDEQGYTRLHAVHLVRQDGAYRALYEDVFGPLPADLADFSRFPDSGGPVAYASYHDNWEGMTIADQEMATAVFANLGKAIAAYERLLLPGPSRFDLYVQAILSGDDETAANSFSPDAIAGLRLFIDKANCVQCHNGPLFTDNDFHNNGAPVGTSPDEGRAAGVGQVLADEFNCLSRYSDADAEDCSALNTVQDGDAAATYAFRTPTLRNVVETAPYMHAGQIDTLAAVLVHYNQAPPALLGQTEIRPLNLSETELTELQAFLLTLSAPPASPPELLTSP